MRPQLPKTLIILAIALGCYFACTTFAVTPSIIQSPFRLEVGQSLPRRTSSCSSSAILAVASVATAALLAGMRRNTAPSSRSRVVAKDGSSWGSMGYGASTTVDSSGKLPVVKLKRGNDEATVYLFGACVTSYKKNGTEWLAVRPDAVMDGSKPISGGLPFCWPQFGPGEIQQHGFARNMNWKLLEEPSEGGVCVLALSDDETTRKMWPHNFSLQYRIELKDDRLATTFTVENNSQSSFSFSGALHSYYAVADVKTCKIEGNFKDATKIDKTQSPPKLCRGESDTVTISKMTEEIYKEVLPGSVILKDATKGELEIVSGGGWRDVVVWNPYGDQKMGYSGFVCIESAELAPVPLAPKSSWAATMDLVPKHSGIAELQQRAT